MPFITTPKLQASFDRLAEETARGLSDVREASEAQFRELRSLILQLNSDAAASAQLRHEHLVGLIERFHQDAAASAQLRHEHLVGLIEGFHQDAAASAQRRHEDLVDVVGAIESHILSRLRPDTSLMPGRPWIEGRVAGATDFDRFRWLRAHIDAAAEEIIGFLEGAGVTLRDRRVVDVGCGDGLIDLGLIIRSEPAELIGVDIVPTDTNELADLARRFLGLDELPAGLRFAQSDPESLPIEDGSADVVVSWSTFEHVDTPGRLLAEIERILAPGGVLFLQIWPLYYSPHGSHLWHWHPNGFAHRHLDRDALIAPMLEDESVSDDVKQAMLTDLDTLNKITLDELNQHIEDAGLRVVRAELLTGVTNIAEAMSDASLSDSLISGVKLIATR
jgi:SAM-dependent methyltransferase